MLVVGAGQNQYAINNSLRFRSSASAYLSRTPTVAGNRQIWTISFWWKRGVLSSEQYIISADTAGANETWLRINAADTLQFQTFGGTNANLTTSAVFRDPSAWYHIVMAYDSTQATAGNRFKLYVNGTQQTLTGTNPTLNESQAINNTVSHQFCRRASTSGSYADNYLTEVYLIDGQALTPSSFGANAGPGNTWQPIRYAGSYGTNGFYLPFNNNSSLITLGYDQQSLSAKHVLMVDSGTNGAATIYAGSGAFVNSTISTSNGSICASSGQYLTVNVANVSVSTSLKIYLDSAYSFGSLRGMYINGTLVASGNVTVTSVSGMYEWAINIGAMGITQITSITTPANSTGRCVLYGVQVDGSTLLPTANDWYTNNISLTAGTTYDSMKDVPTLTSATVANYAVLNPIYSTVYTGNVLAANLQINSPTTDGFCPSTIAVSSGKWYYEVTMTNSTAASFIYGIVKTTAAQAELRNVGTGNGYSYLASTGVKSDGSGGVGTAYGATFTTGDVMGCAFDLDGGSITFYKNGVSQGVAYTGISGEFMAAIGDAASGSGGQTAAVNFGQRPFSYTPPTGYVALNTYNLPTPSLPQGNKYMDATLYTGNTTTVTATNTGAFKPDLVWIKDRTQVAQHVLTDSVRGTSAQLFSSLTNAEQSNSTYVTSFNTNGFTVGVGNSGTGVVNNSGDNFVGWQWQAGQGTTSTNTSGTIPSTVSVNPSAGFSIVTYVGSGINDTVGHGLGVAPKFVIVKSRNPSAAYSWFIYHTSLTSAAYTLSFDTAAQVSTPTVWNSTAPTSTVFSIGTAPAVNESGKNLVAYCWAAIPGFSAFGSYTGNGSTDGPFIYTGFRPKYVMIKCSSTAGLDWSITDSTRNPYNVTTYRLFADTSGAEATQDEFDFLSNGFKIRTVNTNENYNGQTFIYMAFAENPFKYSSAR